MQPMLCLVVPKIEKRMITVLLIIPIPQQQFTRAIATTTATLITTTVHLRKIPL